MDIHIHVGALVKGHGNTLLAIHRPIDDDRFPNIWTIPGGKVEPGETPHEAVIREVFEETGIQIINVSPEPIFNSQLSSNDYSIEIAIYSATPEEIVDPKPIKSDVDGASWITPQKFINSLRDQHYSASEIIKIEDCLKSNDFEI